MNSCGAPLGIDDWMVHRDSGHKIAEIVTNDVDRWSCANAAEGWRLEFDDIVLDFLSYGAQPRVIPAAPLICLGFSEACATCQS